MNRTRVLIGCPVRDRAWILPRYLAALQQLDYPQGNIEYCFIVNDCQDDTLAILQQFKQCSPVQVIEHNWGDRKGKSERGRYSFARLAQLRNLLLEYFLSSTCQYLFSVDSDILVPPQALPQLLDDDKDVIAGLVNNGHHINQPDLFNVLRRTPAGNYVHIKDFPKDKPFPVDCTGAAYLIKREVIVGGARYHPYQGAEDIGFCQETSKRGFSIWCDGRIECDHIMRQN